MRSSARHLALPSDKPFFVGLIGLSAVYVILILAMLAADAAPIKPLTRSLPEADQTEIDQPLSERFLTVVGVLNEVNKFNGEITVTTEVRPLPDGTSIEVTALYVGIGQGYYVGLDDTVAGVGTSTPGGWQWMPANDAAPAIAEAVAILNNEQVAGYIQVPVRVD